MWYKFIEIWGWFGDMSERNKLLKDFNFAAKKAFIDGKASTLLEARITWGDRAYRHEFSKFMGGGFRIKVLSGERLQRTHLLEIGKIILDNEVLVRQLVSLGWDTLEINDSNESVECKFEIKQFLKFGGYLNN